MNISSTQMLITKLKGHASTFLLFLVMLYFSFASAIKLFGSPDDFCSFAASIFEDGCMGNGPSKEQDFFKITSLQAQSQGRFYQLLYYLVAQILVINDTIQYLVKFITAFLLMYVIWRLVKLHYGTTISKITTSLIALTYSFQGTYNSLTGFPGWFSFGYLCFFIFAKNCISLRRGSELPLSKWLSTLLFGFLSITSYEIFILPNLIFCIYASIGIASKHSKFRGILHYIVMFVPFTLYSTMYLAYKVRYPGSYTGTQLANFDFVTILTTLLKLNSASVINNWYFSGFGIGVGIFLMILVLVIFAQITITCLKRKFVSNSVMTNLGTFADIFIWLIVFLSFNIPLALTKRYQDWVDGNPMYLGNFGAHSTLLITIILMYSRIAKNKLMSFYTALLLIMCITTAVISNSRYIQSSVTFNARLKFLELEVRSIDSLSSKDEMIREYDREIGAYPYRYFEAYWLRNKNK